jgi:membrane fusion protein (multidrug efflux system)
MKALLSPCLAARRLAVCLLALGALTACPKRQENRPAPAPPEVQVVEVKQQDVPIYHEYVGTLEGLVNADIQARVSGYLISQNYKEASPVKKGDLLFQIDPRPFEAALAKARASQAQAQASHKQAELTAQRNVDLFARKAVSAQDRDNAVQASLAAQAQVQAAQAVVQQGALDVEFTKIVAPIDGIAGIAKAQVGDLVGPSTGTLTTISTVDPIKVYFTVSEQRYTEFMARYRDPEKRAAHEKEMQFQLMLADGSIYPEPGQFFAGGREVDPRTGSIRIAAVFPNPGNILRPGQFGRVRVLSEMKPGALLVPQRAVMELQGINQVAVVDAKNQVNIRPVVTGERMGTDWLVEKGLAPGERIVVEGVQKVRDGVVVNPKPFSPAAATPVPAP